jgi:hypothetical protein
VQCSARADHCGAQVLVDNGVDVGALLAKVGIEADGKAETAGIHHILCRMYKPLHK